MQDPLPPTPNIIYFRIHREVHIHVLHYFIHLLSFLCWVAHRELPAMDEIGLPGLDENGPGRFVVSHPARVGHSGHARVRASAHLRWCCCKRQQQMSEPHLPRRRRRRRRKNQQQCPWVGSEVERSREALQQARKALGCRWKRPFVVWTLWIGIGFVLFFFSKDGGDFFSWCNQKHCRRRRILEAACLLKRRKRPATSTTSWGLDLSCFARIVYTYMYILSWWIRCFAR